MSTSSVLLVISSVFVCWLCVDAAASEVVPKFVSSHEMFSCGHRSCANDQIRCTVLLGVKSVRKTVMIVFICAIWWSWCVIYVI